MTRKLGTIIFFFIFSRRCCHPLQEFHLHYRNFCLPLPIKSFLLIQHLDKFKFLNFYHTSVCIRYGKTLISDSMIHYFFKGHLLFSPGETTSFMALFSISTVLFCIRLEFFSDVGWFVKPSPSLPRANFYAW